jgi:O-antigen/teichoic acid export membrane protein
MVFGYVLWLILPRLTTSETIGISSTVISVTIIFSAVIDLGVSSGSTRFLGKSFSRRTGDTKVLVNASLLIICTSILVSNIAILFFKDSIFPTIGFDLIIISILLIDTSVIYNILRSILIASLETKSLPKIIFLSSISKIFLTLILVLIGTGAMGITIGYLSGYASAAVLISVTLVTILSSIKKETTLRLYKACKSILTASIPRWVPIVIGILGTNLGTVLVFGTQGASQAGSYFIAFSIFYAIVAIKDSLFAVAFPVLSAMDDQRKTFVSKLIKMSLVISLPICSIVFLYSDDLMGLFGSQYIESSMALKIMSLSMLTSTFAVGIGNLLYSYGSYWKDLAIGIGMNLSRILFYFILVPLYGNTGAAISLTLGSLVGFAVAVIIAKRIGILIFWQQLALIFIIPTGFAFTLGYFHATPIIGIPVIVVLSLILFSILHVLTKSDVRTSLDLLPDSIGKPLIDILNKL